MSKRSIAAVAGLVVVTLFGWLLFSLPRSSVTTTAPQVSHQPMTAAEAKPLEAALSSVDKQVQASAMWPEFSAAYQAQPAHLTADRLIIRKDTFARQGNLGSVEVIVVIGGQEAAHRMTIARSGEKSPWKVMSVEVKR